MNNLPIVGIIAEYNPFHNGHAYQISKIKQLLPNCRIIAVMSGDFTQRGLPALLDKWNRAALAVQNGVDLVIELPFHFACRSAEWFAQGGVGILNALAIVDYLAFGAECSSPEQLQQLATELARPACADQIKQYMKTGCSYPKALQQSTCNPELVNILRQPNNILAIEYLKQLQTLRSPLRPLSIVRSGSDYHDTAITGRIASATALREQLRATGLSPEIQNALPESVHATIADCYHADSLVLDTERLSSLAVYQLRNLNPEYLRRHTDVSEGLEYRILTAAAKYNTYQQIIANSGGNRYPHSRIARIIIQTLVGMHPTLSISYARILAFSNDGRNLLTKIKAKSNLPLITKLGRDFADIDRHLDMDSLSDDVRAANLYQQLLPNNAGRHNIDFFRSPKPYPCIKA